MRPLHLVAAAVSLLTACSPAASAPESQKSAASTGVGTSPVLLDAGPRGANVGADAGEALEAPVGDVGAFGDRSIELACNGIDDDGDGLVDVLLPVGPNACRAPGRGACAAGFAACEGGKRVCLAPSPMPEVADGIDNDCNGVNDDAAPLTVHPRAIVLAPRYAWSDARSDVANVSSSLAQAGIPYDRTPTGADWGPLSSLDDYALAIVPGYLLSSAVATIDDKLEAFVRRGGVLVVFKPIAQEDRSAALRLAGLVRATRRRDIDELRFDGVATPATSGIDSPEERALGINRRGTTNGIEVWTFEPDPAERTEVLVRAYVAGAPAGAAITRRRIGKGAVYAVGHDLATFEATRCYVNCFEPSGDVMRLLLEGALREAASGHVVFTHTVPDPASSVLMLTHDVNTHEAHNAGDWGAPGAVQMATVEQARGVPATFNVMTDYRGRHYNAGTMKKLCALDQCPVGLQGVAQVPKFAKMPDGFVQDPDDKKIWRCKETLGEYTSPSLCGEVLLSRQLLRNATSRAARVWRSPHMALHPRLFDVLASAGILYDSSLAVGDLGQNLPLDLENVGLQQGRFRHARVIEFPLTCDDGFEVTPGKRLELNPATENVFRAHWEYVAIRNAHNRSFTTLRVHPGRGPDAPAANVAAKALALDRFIGQARKMDLVFRSVEAMGDFWRARLEAKLEARFDSKVGYAGSLTTGKTAVAGMTLEFGDTIRDFDCPACGEVKVAGKRAMVVKALAPSTKFAFVAKLR